MEYIRKDQGFAWIVMLAAFFIMAFGVSLPTFGEVSVMTYIWVTKFNIDPEMAAWGTAVMNASLYMTCPVLTMIVHSIGCAKTVLMGIVVTLIGAVAGAFVDQFWHVMITFAILQGVGAALSQMVCFELIGLYFERHRDKVMAALVALFYVGMLIGPSLVELLFRVFTYKHASLVLAGIISFCLPWLFVFLFQGSYKRGKNDNSIEEPHVQSNCDGTEIQPSSSTNEVEADLGEKIEQEDCASKKKADRWKIIRFHKTVLTQPSFVIILTSCFFMGLSMGVVYAYVVIFVVQEKNIVVEQGAFGMTLEGVALVVGSALLSILSMLTFSRLTFQLVVLIFYSLSPLLMPWADTAGVYYTLIIFFGLGESLVYANLPSLLYELGEGHMLIRLSYTYFLFGVGMFLGPVIGGAVYKYSSPNGAFFFSGAAGIMSSICLVPLIIVNCKQKPLKTGSPELNDINSNNIEKHI